MDEIKELLKEVEEKAWRLHSKYCRAESEIKTLRKELDAERTKCEVLQRRSSYMYSTLQSVLAPKHEAFKKLKEIK
jgi:molecular chaperone GrpE (heat shock protein)